MTAFTLRCRRDLAAHVLNLCLIRFFIRLVIFFLLTQLVGFKLRQTLHGRLRGFIRNMRVQLQDLWIDMPDSLSHDGFGCALDQRMRDK